MSSIHADSGNTVRVSARRFESSPFFESYVNEHTVMGVYAGRYYTIFNGEDSVETYWALRRKSVLYDVPERPVQIAGPDAVPFMERIFARRIGNLKEGRGRYGIAASAFLEIANACTPQGGVFIDGVLFNLAKNTYWYVQPDGALETWLTAHSEGYDVTISDPRARVLQIQGPTSFAVMKAASDGTIDESMGYFHSGFHEIGGQKVYVSRTGWTGELGYEIYAQWDGIDCARLWKHLLSVGKPRGMVFSSIASMEIRRIEAAILDNGTDMDQSMTPFQSGLAAFIDMDKDDFIGKKALVHADRRTLLYGFKGTTASPGMNDMICDGAMVVGRCTAGAMSPYLQCGIGYVRFAEPGQWAGKILTLNTADGKAHECEIIDLPFYDRDKKIPRGIDKTVP
jgi:glycine cleavage system aminomethyltransferase T